MKKGWVLLLYFLSTWVDIGVLVWSSHLHGYTERAPLDDAQRQRDFPFDAL